MNVDLAVAFWGGGLGIRVKAPRFRSGDAERGLQTWVGPALGNWDAQLGCFGVGHWPAVSELTINNNTKGSCTRMRTFIKNYIEAKKAQKLEETGEEGFSLIELIVVVVILGVLAAVAIPIFLNIQEQAEQSAADTTAANAATQWAAATAQNQTPTFTNFPGYTVTVSAGATLDSFCVTAVQSAALGAKTGTAGTAPGC